MQRVYPNGTLILEHIQKTDEGILTCQAKGRQGQVSSRDLHLRVVGEFLSILSAHIQNSPNVHSLIIN